VVVVREGVVMVLVSFVRHGTLHPLPLAMTSISFCICLSLCLGAALPVSFFLVTVMVRSKP